MKPSQSWKFVLPPLVILAVAMSIALFHRSKGANSSSSTTSSTGSSSTASNSGAAQSASGESNSARTGVSGASSEPTSSGTSADSSTSQASGGVGNAVEAGAPKNSASLPSVTAGAGGNAPAAGGALSLGSNSGSSGSSSGAAPESKAAPVALPPTCVTASFHVSDSDNSCKANRHVIKLGLNKEELAKFHLDTLCIRAGNRPVRFEAVKGKADEFMIPSVSRKGDVALTARYCFAAVPCNDGCKVPAPEKDEFLEAIGGTDDEKPAAGVGVWDPNDKEGAVVDVTAQIDGEVKKRLAQTEDEDRAPANLQCVYRRWENAGTSPAACMGRTQAKLETQ